MIFSVPLSLVTRRVSGKRMLLVAFLGYFICNLLSATAPNFTVILIARCVGGIAHAIFFSACIGQAARLAPPGRTARAFAMVAVGISAGYILGSPLTTALGGVGGWRLPLFVLIGLSAAAGALIAWLLPVTGKIAPAESAGRVAIGRSAGVITANGLTYLGQYVLYTYVTLLLLQAGLPQSLVAIALLVYGVAGLAAIAATASLLDGRPRATSVAVLLVVAVSMALVGILSSSLVPLLVFGLLWGAAFGPVATVFQSTSVRTGALGPEIAGAWINTTSNLGIAGGAILGGIVLDQAGFAPLALVAAIPVTIAAITMAFVVSRNQREAALSRKTSSAQ